MASEKSEHQTAGTTGEDDSLGLYDGPEESAEESAESPEVKDSPESSDSVETAEADRSSEATGGDTGEAAAHETLQSVPVSDRMVQFAVGMGMPEYEARQFSSDASLQDHLNMIGAEYARMGAAGPAPAAAPAPGQPPAEPELPEFEPFKLDGFDTEDLDPTVIKIIQAQDEHYRKQMARFQRDTADTFKYFAAPVQQAQQQAAMAANQGYIQEFDAALGRVGGAYKDLIGEGPSAEVGRAGGTPWSNRLLLDKHFGALVNSYANLPRGVAKPGMDQLMSMALQAAFGNRTEQEARDKVADDVARHKTRAVNRSTSRRSGNGRATDRYRDALTAIREKMTDMGLDPGPEPTPLVETEADDLYI